MVEFQSRDDVKKWLEARPEKTHGAETLVLASRAALRVVPLLAELKNASDISSKGQSGVILAVMRGVSLSWVTAMYPSLGSIKGFVDRAEAAFLAGHNVPVSSSNAVGPLTAARLAGDVAFAAEVVFSGEGGGFFASGAAEGAFAPVEVAKIVAEKVAFDREAGFNPQEANDEVNRAAAYAAVYTTAFGTDATQIEAGVSPPALAGQPLWPGGVPQWALDDWEKLKSGLLNSDEPLRVEDWGVWTDWYQARLDGALPWSEAVEIARVLEPTEEDWSAGSEVVNRKLREIMNRERGNDEVSGEVAASAGIEPPALPEPSMGVQFGERQQRLDIQVSHPSEAPSLSNRTKVLLDELREVVREFEGSFDLNANIHTALRGTASRYRQQIEHENPSIDLIFALGLRLENADLTAKREIAAGLEPELENSQHSALRSLLQIHGVFIATSDEGQELLAAAERYQHKPQDDESFKVKAGPVVDGMSAEIELATERALELVKGAITDMNTGHYPARTGMIGRNTLLNGLLVVCKAAVYGITAKIAGEISVATEAGQFVISHGAPFADKSIHFLLDNASRLRELIAVSPEAFGFVGRVIDWIKVRLGFARE
jgi:hypothetical protein